MFWCCRCGTPSWWPRACCASSPFRRRVAYDFVWKLQVYSVSGSSHMIEFRAIMSESYLKEDDWKNTVYTFVHLKSRIKGRFLMCSEKQICMVTRQMVTSSEKISLRHVSFDFRRKTDRLFWTLAAVPDLHSWKSLSISRHWLLALVTWQISSEAHPSDGWKFQNNFDINKHNGIQDRKKRWKHC